MTTTVQIALICVAALGSCAQAAESPTCEFGPNKETPETLTCTFENDLKELKHGFTVQRYCYKNGLKPVVVQLCQWSDDKGHICQTLSPGYSFNASTISNKAVLGIECLTSDIDGNYSCQLYPPNNGVENKCLYKHLDAPKKTSCAIEQSEKTLEKLSCTFGVDLGQQKHGFNVHRYEENEDPAIVLSCIWTKGVPGLRCYVAPGYTFDNSTISTNIVLKIPIMEGNYTCQLIPRVCEDNIEKPCKHDTATVKAMCVFEPNTEKPENLNCTCGGDAEQMKHNFSVHVIRYGKNPAVVLSCNWKKDQPTCTNLSDGFTFDSSIVSSRIVLGIQNSTLIDLEGVYRCHVILPLGEYDINQTCSYKNDGSDQENGLNVGAKVGIACGVVGVVAVVVVYFVRRRQRINSRQGQDDDGNDNELQDMRIPNGDNGQDGDVNADELQDMRIPNEDNGQDDHDDPAEVEDKMIHNEDVG